MATAREQARTAALRLVDTGTDVVMEADIIADAASAVWESLLEQCKEEVQDLAAKVQFLVNWMDSHGHLEDGTFTFPDGDTREAQR